MLDTLIHRLQIIQEGSKKSNRRIVVNENLPTKRHIDKHYQERKHQEDKENHCQYIRTCYWKKRQFMLNKIIPRRILIEQIIVYNYNQSNSEY